MDIEGLEEFTKANSSQYPRKLNNKSQANVNNDAKTRSHENLEEEEYVQEDLDDESDDEEPPVLPREIMKQKLDNKYAGSSGKKEQKGKSNKRTITSSHKKRKVNQMDSALIKKLEFYKRPKNSVSQKIDFSIL